eukprot:2491556-Prymnesium_polylepis.1
MWAALDSDDDRVRFGDTDGPTTAIQLLQRALVAVSRPTDALEAAEYAHARSLQIVLAKQRMERRATSKRPHAKAITLSVDNIRALASRKRVALIVFSQLAENAIFAWVIDSAGTITF